MSENFIFETAFTGDIDNDVKTVVKAARRDGKNIRPLAQKVVESSEGKRLQVLAEAHESDFEKELPVEVEDIIEEPSLDGPIEDEEPVQTLEESVEELVEVVKDLVESIEDEVVDGDDDEDEPEGSFDDPDLDSVETFDDEDDNFFESKRKRARANAMREIRRRAAKARRERLAASRSVRPRRARVERRETPMVDSKGDRVPVTVAKKSASALPREDKSLAGYKLARLGRDTKRRVYVAEYIKP